MAISTTEVSAQNISTTEYSLLNNSTTLTPSTQSCVMQAYVDLTNLAAGDQYEFKIYEKVVSGGTQRVLVLATLTGPQSNPLAFPAFVLKNGWDVTGKKLAGTDRAFSWSIRTVT